MDVRAGDSWQRVLNGTGRIALTQTVSQRLTEFLRQHVERGVPEEVMHEAKRLLLNQLKASVAAVDNPAIEILHRWAADDTSQKVAHVLWLGTQTSVEHAAFVNGALFEVLDFHDTYIPTFLHAVSGILPAVLAEAEAGGQSGREVLRALALGIEVELACATILMPTGYYRGFVPLGLVGGVGAAAACAVLGGLDDTRICNALGLAMFTASGPYESVGSMALPAITGQTARSGLTAYQLGKRGVNAPATAFEGEKGMLSCYSDEPAEKIDETLATLGHIWRIHGQSYKTMPTETITHAPVECTLALHRRSAGREIERILFQVQPIVVKIADERFERFGAPTSELEARFDLRYCAAAAWQRGRFFLAEMKENAYTDPDILALRSRIELEPDPARSSFDGCALEIRYTDGSSDQITIDAFRGSAANPIADEELAEVFRMAAEGRLPAGRADDIVDTVFGLEFAPDIHRLMELARH